MHRLKKWCAYVGQALALDRNRADAYRASGLLLMLQVRHDEAAVDTRKPVELAPSSADVAVFACVVLASAGFAEEAVVQI
jgi:Tfp pilus assembly protein PilF